MTGHQDLTTKGVGNYSKQSQSFQSKAIFQSSVPSLKLLLIAPENGPSQKETSIPTIHFQELCWFQGGSLKIYAPPPSKTKMWQNKKQQQQPQKNKTQLILVVSFGVHFKEK